MAAEAPSRPGATPRPGAGWRWAALVGAALCWGSSASLSKHALSGFAPMTLLVLDLAIATAVLWAALLARGRAPVRHLGRLALLGLLQPALTYVPIVWGLAYTTASNAAVLAATESCFVVLLAAPVLRERLGPRAAGCLLATVAGVWLLDGGAGLRPRSGDALVLAGALAAAAYTVLAKAWPPGVDPLSMTAYQFLFGLLWTAPVAVLRWSTGAEPLPTAVGAGPWAAAVAAGVVGYGLSFLLFNTGLAGLPAGPVGMTINLVPVFGVAVAMVTLGERLSPVELAGAAVVVLSVALFPRPRPAAARLRAA